MHPNEPVLVWSLGALPLGARVLQDDGDETLWLDVVTMGQHLPQLYARKDVELLDAQRAPELGLCPACLGYGTLTSALEIPLATTSDEIDNLCSECGGSGRPAIRVQITRTPGTTQGQMEVLAHEHVPGNKTIPCLACGFELNEPYARHIGPT